MTNLSSGLKSRHYFVNKGPSGQVYGFPSSQVWMWELDHKEGWVPKIWCFWTVVLEKTLESPLDCKEIQPVHPTGNQPWIFIGRTDAEAETPMLWPPDAKKGLIGKDPDAGKDWRYNRWWDGWMASPTRWTWVWASSGSWWWTGRPGMLQSMGSQRVRHDWATELIDSYLYIIHIIYNYFYIFPYMLNYLCPWDSPGKNTGVGCHFLVQGIFLTQGSNPCLRHWQADSSPLGTQEALTQ